MQALKYEEDYLKCLECLERAKQLDPEWNSPRETQDSLTEYLDTVQTFVKTKGKTKEKKLNQLLKSLKEKNTLGPYGDGCFVSQAGSKVTLDKIPFNLLKTGENKEKVVCGVVICSVNTQDYVPL
jgi:hypothetical protein